jgi:hypothetical protein
MRCAVPLDADRTAELAENRLKDALAMCLSYILASVVPLAPYFFLPIKSAFAVSVALAAIVLVALGAIKGVSGQDESRAQRRRDGRHRHRFGRGGYLLGTLVPHIVGK